MAGLNEQGITSQLAAVSTGRSFRFTLAQVAKAVELVYRTADRLCCADPVVAAHVRELADRMAAEALQSFRQWPQSGGGEHAAH